MIKEEYNVKEVNTAMINNSKSLCNQQTSIRNHSPSKLGSSRAPVFSSIDFR